MRILGIDFGTKICGFAISDSRNIIASALTSFEYTNNNYMLIIKKIKQIMTNYTDINKIVIGYPTMTLTGEKTKTAIHIDKLISLMELNIKDVEIIKWNENYTTKIANDYLCNFDIKSSKRKKIIDIVSATFILQSYLDQLKK